MSQLPAALSRIRALAGLASAVVPAAILVHLVAEILAVGHAGIGLDFMLRHVYLGVLLALSAWSFAHTVGLSRGRAEVRRRTALLRSALLDQRRRTALPVLAAANLAFFGITQAGEGLPILSGSLWVGLAAGVAGSLLAAVLVYAFGRSLVVAAIEALAHVARRAPVVVSNIRPRGRTTSRSATALFSLIIPNRPPPARPSSDTSLHQKGTSCFHSLVLLVGRRRISPASHSF